MTAKNAQEKGLKEYGAYDGQSVMANYGAKTRREKGNIPAKQKFNELSEGDISSIREMYRDRHSLLS